MRRSAYVTAPLLATAATAALSGCHAPVPYVEQRGETIVGGFGASLSEHPVLWWFAAAGAIVVAGRFVSAGE